MPEKIAVVTTLMATIPGNMNFLKSKPAVRADQPAHAVAEDEQEQHRLDQPAEDARPGAHEADQLAHPHHPDRAELVAQDRVGALA